jgi:hypothetical protein
MKKYILILALIFSFVTNASAIGDKVSLEGLKQSKIIFDVNIADAKIMPLYLSVILQTYNGLKEQNVKPNIILAFRGKAVQFLVSKGNDDKTIALIKKLISKKEIQVEGCSVAASIFKVDPKEYFDGVRAVGNTFISLGAYQSKGYAIIPLY